jgi:peptide/nickel transport system permease protein
MTATMDIDVEQAIVEERARRARRRPGSVGAWLGAAWLILISALALFADYLPFVRGYAQQVPYARNFAVHPGSDFWFGSDQLGRDVFARCVYGARVSLLVAFTSILVGLTVGGVLGILGGYYRGRADRATSIVADCLLAFPPVVLAILIVGRADALADSGFSVLWWHPTRTWSVVFVLSLLSIAPITRIVRAQTLSLTQREFVIAARAVGATNRRVIWREIMPNLVPAMVSVAFTGIAILLVAEGALAFLGYSVRVPTPTWGYLINESRPKMRDAWWPTLFPCMMLFLTVVAFNLIGDRVARHFDIKEAAL